MRFKDLNSFDISTFRAGKNIASRNDNTDTEKNYSKISHRLAPRVKRKASHAIVTNADIFTIMQKKYAMLLLFVLSWHVPLKIVTYPACSYTKVMQVAKIGCLVCVAGVAPHVLAKPALILLTRPVATGILSIPHKFPFELVGFCEGVDHDYDLGFRHSLFSRSLFSTSSQA